ncbi:MAG: hypothetical protein AAB932_05550 [Patescibacteria group bacterium]
MYGNGWFTLLVISGSIIWILTLQQSAFKTTEYFLDYQRSGRFFCTEKLLEMPGASFVRPQCKEFSDTERSNIVKTGVLIFIRMLISSTLITLGIMYAKKWKYQKAQIFWLATFFSAPIIIGAVIIAGTIGVPFSD